MNITFLVNYDLASTLALNYLLPDLLRHDVCVYFTNKEANSNNRLLLDLASFESKILQSFDKTRSTQLHKSISMLNEYCTKPIVELNDVNNDDFQQLSDSEPDLIISIRHMTILKHAVIDLPEYAVINLHSGLLPAYQGVMASFWAMLNREKNLGTTLHYIEDSSVDTGAIISESQQACDYSKSYLWNVFSLYKTGSLMILKTIEKMKLEGNIQSFVQTGKPQYFSYPTDAEIKTFTKNGNVLFQHDDLIDFQLIN